MNDIEVPRAVAGRFAARQVKASAGRLVRGLDERVPGFVEQLRADPLGALAVFAEITFMVRSAAVGSRCSVLGRYDGEVDPPTITITRTSPGQTRFTALHELGHHEQRGDVDWFDAALSRGAPGADRLEEQVCEAFAAEILLGDDVVAAVLGDQPITADSVTALRSASGASRAACSVRVAQMLGAQGFVMVGGLDGNALFTAASGDRVPPAKNVYQGERSVLTIAGHAGRARDDDADVRYRTGSRFGGLRADAVRDGDYVYAVFTEGRAGWRKLDIGGGAGHWIAREQDCRCGTTFARTGRDMCPECGTERCPDCARCGCGVVERVRTCTQCYLQFGAGMFTQHDTICDGCMS